MIKWPRSLPSTSRSILVTFCSKFGRKSKTKVIINTTTQRSSWTMTLSAQTSLLTIKRTHFYANRSPPKPPSKTHPLINTKSAPINSEQQELKIKVDQHLCKTHSSTHQHIRLAKDRNKASTREHRKLLERSASVHLTSTHSSYHLVAVARD